MTPSWDEITVAMAKLRMRMEESIGIVQMDTEDSLLRVADARDLREARHGDQAKIKKEYER